MAQSPAIQAIVEGLRESAARMEEFAARSRELAQQLEGVRAVHGVQAIEALALMKRITPGWDDAMGQFETMKVAIESLVELLRR